MKPVGISASIVFVQMPVISYVDWAENRGYTPGGGGGGVLRFGSDGGVPLKPPNPYLSLRVILAEKGTHY